VRLRDAQGGDGGLDQDKRSLHLRRFEGTSYRLVVSFGKEFIHKLLLHVQDKTSGSSRGTETGVGLGVVPSSSNSTSSVVNL